MGGGGGTRGGGEESRRVVMVKPCIPSTQGRGVTVVGKEGAVAVRWGVGGDGRKWELRGRCPPGVHLFLGGWAVRGGVTGRPELTPPYWYLAFFSEGFRIWKEHMRDSSTLIMPPALSNSPQ